MAINIKSPLSQTAINNTKCNASSLNSEGNPIDPLGYVQFVSPSAGLIDQNLFTEQDLLNVPVKETGVNNKKGCNISFNNVKGISFNLPDSGFKFGPAEFDKSLFEKCDSLSRECTMLNDMIINTVQELGGGSTAQVYNATVVPFFKFFADGEGEFVNIVLRYTEIVTAMRAVVEPLESMVRFIPGNPWVPKDVDPLAWIYSYYKESKPYLDRLLSGSLIDVVLNPVNQIRTKLQATLTGGLIQGAITQEFFEIGSPEQLKAMSEIAVKGGSTLIDAKLPSLSKPKKPIVHDYPGGESNPSYKKDLLNFENLFSEYQSWSKINDQLLQEMSRQAKAMKDINLHLAIAGKTQQVLKQSSQGIVGAVADALNVQKTMIEPFIVRTTDDLYKMVGKRISGLTNKSADAASKNRPKDKPYAIEEKDLRQDRIVKNIVNAGSGSKPRATKKTSELKSIVNEYAKIGIGSGKIMTKVDKITDLIISADPYTILKQNDKNKKEMEQLEVESENLNVELIGNITKLQNKWTIDRNNLLSKLLSFKTLLGRKKEELVKIKDPIKKRELTLEISKSDIEYNIAQEIYNSYFSTFRTFDFAKDPYDMFAIANYLKEDEFWGLFPPNYWNIVNELNAIKFGGLSNEIRAIPYPPNTPPETIIEDLPIATEVDVDERFNVNYFNAGFVREKGSNSWRNFNRLNIVMNDQAKSWGAIGSDKTEIYYLAIFPNDTIGDQACVSYSRDKYNPTTIIDEYCRSEITVIDMDETVYEDFLDSILAKYNINRYDELQDTSDENLISIIYEISIVNGYKPGKLWIRTRKIKADIPLKYEYTYSYSNNALEIIQVNKKIIDVRELEATFAVTTSNIALTAKEITNSSIRTRGKHYEIAAKKEMQQQAKGKGLDKYRSNLMNSIASMVPQELPIPMETTGDALVTLIVNTVIEYIMGALDRLMKELIDMIVQYLIPDWIKDLIRTIKDFLMNLMSIFTILKTIADIHFYTEDLLDMMKGRIISYNSSQDAVKDWGLIPEAPFSGGIPTYQKFTTDNSTMPGDIYEPEEPLIILDDGNNWEEGEGPVYFPPAERERGDNRNDGTLYPDMSMSLNPKPEQKPFTGCSDVAGTSGYAEMRVNIPLRGGISSDNDPVWYNGFGTSYGAGEDSAYDPYTKQGHKYKNITYKEKVPNIGGGAAVPLVVHPPVNIKAGDQGRKYPGFSIPGDYILM